MSSTLKLVLRGRRDAQDHPAGAGWLRRWPFGPYSHPGNAMDAVKDLGVTDTEPGENRIRVIIPLCLDAACIGDPLRGWMQPKQSVR